MNTNRWIEISQYLYRQLLRLYPQAYRTTYETEMFRVFTDQCRDAYQQWGRLGMLSLWLRTLMDVGKTIVIEHISDPNAKVGLLDAVPNAPLPWKGVLLVLIPGMIFFISQIEQVTSNGDWFFLAYYRAAYFLILPVLLIWILTRRFPIWGLIPFGLLYGTLRSYNLGYLISKFPFISYPNGLNLFGITFDPVYLIPVSVCVALLCGLIWYNARHHQFSKSAWGWLTLYGALLIFQIVAVTYRAYTQEIINGSDWESIKQSIFQSPIWYLYDSLPFLLLVFIGKIFARQHGGYSFLLLLGYLLPVIVFGRYGEWMDFIPFYAVVLAVLIYRFVVALVAPIWLVREASSQGRQRAAAVPVALAILCQMILNIVINVLLINQYAYQINWLDFALGIWNQLLIAAGLGLAVTLYFPKEKDTAVVSPPLEAVTE